MVDVTLGRAQLQHVGHALLSDGHTGHVHHELALLHEPVAAEEVLDVGDATVGGDGRSAQWAKPAFTTFNPPKRSIA
ncbi:MAG: hypothetical protein QY325_12775 [Flavobacteriales bacterium]|nr:MAG: hypothetical protein QY325_12775 [Flavobacteriales bacterium]